MNILHGDAASGSFKHALKAPQEEIIVFHDVLSCGPLRKYTDIQSWWVFRENYWNNLDPDSDIESLSYKMLERDFYDRFSDFEAAHEYKLWIGTGISDQLLLAFLVNLFDLHGLDFRKLSVYQFEKIEGKVSEIQGLGLLNPDQIRNHPPAYVLNDRQIKMAKLAWEAVTDNNPEKYLLYMSTDDECLPLMKRAMGYIFYRYPKANNGLSYFDETLLKNTEKHGPKTAKVLGYTLTDDLRGLDLVGDFYLFCRLKNLGRPSLCSPLININALDLPMRDTEVSILPDGIKALSDDLNVIKENGIDDWVGGVHLHSLNKNVWVRNNEGLFRQNF